MNRREVLGSVGAVSVLPAFAGASALAGSQPSTAFEATLRLADSQAGSGNHRWATIAAGIVTGGAARGRILAGRLDWHVDPLTGAAEAVASCTVSCTGGGTTDVLVRSLGATRFGNGLVRLRALP